MIKRFAQRVCKKLIKHIYRIMYKGIKGGGNRLVKKHKGNDALQGERAF